MVQSNNHVTNIKNFHQYYFFNKSIYEHLFKIITADVCFAIKNYSM